MLRNIVATYKAVFLVFCALLLGGSLILGFGIMIWGQTVQERWSGVGVMVGGSFFALMLVGNLALILENNELLRRIADLLSGSDETAIQKRTLNTSPPSQSFQRREPTL